VGKGCLPEWYFLECSILFSGRLRLIARHSFNRLTDRLASRLRFGSGITTIWRVPSGWPHFCWPVDGVCQGGGLVQCFPKTHWSTTDQRWRAFSPVLLLLGRLPYAHDEAIPSLGSVRASSSMLSKVWFLRRVVRGPRGTRGCWLRNAMEIGGEYVLDMFQVWTVSGCNNPLFSRLSKADQDVFGTCTVSFDCNYQYLDSALPGIFLTHHSYRLRLQDRWKTKKGPGTFTSLK